MSSKFTWLHTLLPVLVAFFGARIVLLSFNDPEGPNLLVISLLGLFIYFMAWLPFKTFATLSRQSGFKHALLMILFEIFLASVLYLSLL